jgi:hypothetical protein
VHSSQHFPVPGWRQKAAIEPQLSGRNYRPTTTAGRNYSGAPGSGNKEALRGFDGFSATPAETCAAVPKGRRHFFVLLLVLDWKFGRT